LATISRKARRPPARDGPSVGHDGADERGFAIGAGVFARNLDRDRIDVRGDHAPAPQLGSADREQARAAAEIEHARVAPAFRKIAELM
jgi:hypothetical protein